MIYFKNSVSIDAFCTATWWSQFSLSWLSLIQSQDDPRYNRSYIKQYFSLASRRDGIDWRPIFCGRNVAVPWSHIRGSIHQLVLWFHLGQKKSSDSFRGVRLLKTAVLCTGKWQWTIVVCYIKVTLCYFFFFNNAALLGSVSPFVWWLGCGFDAQKM